MMSKLKKAVTQLVLDEYGLASEQYGEKHHTPHEGYAVILEEFEEAQHEERILEDKLEDFWEGAKADSELACKLNAKTIKERAINAACEMIQVAAMAHKALRGYEVER